MAKRGLFITFEGTEGSGKTTQAELLGEWLAKRDPVVVREPGGTELGEQIRDVLLYKGLEIDPEAETYLFMASRRQLIAEVIAPSLASGQGQSSICTTGSTVGSMLTGRCSYARFRSFSTASAGGGCSPCASTRC